MQIWLTCINFFKHWKPKKSLYCIQTEIINGYQYTWQDIDFGKEGLLISLDDNIIIKFHFTYRDGIFVQIKRRVPYRIFFEYFDGAYFFNLVQEKGENILSITNISKLKDNLDMLQSEHKMGIQKNDAFTKLECIFFEFIKE